MDSCIENKLTDIHYGQYRVLGPETFTVWCCLRDCYSRQKVRDMERYSHKNYLISVALNQISHLCFLEIGPVIVLKRTLLKRETLMFQVQILPLQLDY